MDKKILVPLDGSKIAEAILPLICKLAGEMGDELVLLHVVEYPYELYSDSVCSNYPPTDPNLLETIRRKEWGFLCNWEAYLEELATRLTKLGYKVCTEVCEGPVVQTIIGTALRLQADFIALSTYGSGGHLSGMIGSVANRVLHEARTPVMAIVHPEQDVFQIEPAIVYQTANPSRRADIIPQAG